MLNEKNAFKIHLNAEYYSLLEAWSAENIKSYREIIILYSLHLALFIHLQLFCN